MELNVLLPLYEQLKVLAECSKKTICLFDKNHQLIFSSGPIPRFCFLANNSEVSCFHKCPYRIGVSDHNAICKNGIQYRMFHIDEVGLFVIGFARGDELSRADLQSLSDLHHCAADDLCDSYFSFPLVGSDYDSTLQVLEYSINLLVQQHKSTLPKGDVKRLTAADVYVIHLNLLGKVEYANDLTLSAFAQMKSSIIGRSIDDLTSYFVSEYECNIFKLCLRNRKPYTLCCALRVHGQVLWMRTYMAPKVDNNNAIVGTLLQSYYLTMADKNEEFQTDSTLGVDKAIEINEHYVVSLNLNREIVYANYYFCKLIKRSFDSIVGCSFDTLLEESDLSNFHSACDSVFKERSQELNYSLLSSTHDQHRLHAILTPHYNETHQVDGLALQSIDEVKATSKELHLNEEDSVLASLLVSDQLNVLMCDVNGLCVFANDAVIHLLSLDMPIVGKSIDSLFVKDGDGVQFKAHLNELWHQHKAFQIEIPLGCIDSICSRMSLRATPRYDDEKCFAGYLILVVDGVDNRAERVECGRELMYSNITNSGDTLIMLASFQQEFLYANAPLLRYLALDLSSFQQLSSLNSYCVTPPEKSLFSSIISTIENGQSYVHELQLRNGFTNEYRWFKVTHSICYNQHENVSYWMIQAYDINDLKLKELRESLEVKKCRESEQFFKDLSNLGDLMIWQMNAEAQFTYINKPLMRFLGQDLLSVQKNGWSQFVHPSERVSVELKVQQLLLQREKGEGIVRLFSSESQSYRFIRVLYSPWYEKGVFCGFMGHCSDVTAMEESREEHCKQEHRFHEVYDCLPDVYFSISVDGVILELSPSISALFSHPIDVAQVIGRSIESYSAFVDVDKIHAILSEAIRVGELIDREIVFNVSVGSRKVCSLNANYYPTDESRRGHVVGVIRNVTLSRQREDDVINRVSFYDLLMQQLPAFLYCKNLSGQYVYVNRYLLDTLGLPKEEVLNSTYDEIVAKQHSLMKKRMLNDTCIAFRESNNKSYYQHVVHNGLYLDSVSHYQQINGEDRYIHMFEFPVYDSKGILKGLQGYGQDVTDLTLSIERLSKLNEELSIAVKKSKTATLLYDFTLTGYFNLNQYGLIKELNVTALNFIGNTKKAVVGHSMLEFLQPSYYPVYNDFLKQLQKTPNTSVSCELVYLKKLSRITVMVQGIFSINSLEFLITMVDISNLRDTELELRKERCVLEKTEGLSKTGSWRYDIVKKELAYSTEFLNLLELESDLDDVKCRRLEMESDFVERMGPESLSIVNEFKMSIMQFRVPCHCEFTYRLKSGALHRFYMECHGDYEVDGTLISLLGLLCDITDQKK